MITGDYHHTALAVAKQAGMVRPDSEIVIVDIPKHIHSQQSRVGMAAAGASLRLRAAPPTPELMTSARASGDSLPDLPCLISARSSDLQSLRARLANLERLQAEESRFAGLRFVDGEHNQELDASDALASLAEGRAQCAVTGPAFKVLLQQQGLSVSLQVIMQSAVVFARMQPHQKGEAMDLITSQGIHQLTASGSHYIAVTPAVLSGMRCMQSPPLASIYFWQSHSTPHSLPHTCQYLYLLRVPSLSEVTNFAICKALTRLLCSHPYFPWDGQCVASPHGSITPAAACEA